VKFKSPLITKGSGSVAGLTFSRNKSGNYIRERSLPTNPNTPYQQAVRGFFSALAVLWQDTLTPVMRASWSLYADNVPVTDRIGDSINLTGLNMYIRSNVPRLQAGEPRVDAGPVIFNLGSFTNPTIEIDKPNAEVDVTFDDTDEWANEDDAAMLVYGSTAKDPTINYFKNPYRILGAIQGDAIAAPATPAALFVNGAIETGQRMFFRFVVSRADGRLSPDFRLPADAG
jgi:hypothetical protein